MKKKLKSSASAKYNTTHVGLNNSNVNDNNQASIFTDNSNAMSSNSSLLNQVCTGARFLNDVRRHQLFRVKNMVENNLVDVNYKNAEGINAIYIATLVKDLGLMQFLKDAGANLNCKTKLGDTPLNCALGFVNHNYAKFLIKNGANIADFSPIGETPLHTAVKNGQIKLIHLLLKLGANIEAISTQGLKPLDLALKNMHLEAASILLENGAEISEDNVEDVIVEPLNIQDFLLTYLVTAASILDNVENKETYEFHDPYQRIKILYANLDQSCKIVLISRLLNKAFRNKEFTSKKLINVYEQLTSKVNFFNELKSIELMPVKETLIKLDKCLNLVNLQNEEGRVPSLFRLSVLKLQDNKLWDQETKIGLCPDILEKALALQDFYKFLEKFHIKLFSEESKDAVMSDLLYNENNMMLMGDDGMETDMDFYGIS